MEGFSYFIKGIILGFSIAAPVGPIGVLCMRRTLSYGRWSGFFSGLGAATADAVYGAIAAFGLTAVTNALVGAHLWLKLIGGIFLLYLGIRTYFRHPASNGLEVKRSTLASDFISTFLLTFTNPMTILSFVAVFAGIGIGTVDHDFAFAVSLIFGIFVGSSFWWFILSEGIATFRRKFSQKALQWINRLAGLILFLFGLYCLFTLF